jgi:hypothetical protein
LLLRPKGHFMRKFKAQNSEFKGRVKWLKFQASGVDPALPRRIFFRGSRRGGRVAVWNLPLSHLELPLSFELCPWNFFSLSAQGIHASQ